jgi:dihydroorotate dehydrogenase
MVCIPGVATPTEAFDALEAGASALKLFPAELVTPAVLKSMRAVLDTSTVLLPVGGITPTNMAVFRAAGADGFGIGSALFQPGMAIASLRQNATQFVGAWRALTGPAIGTTRRPSAAGPWKRRNTDVATSRHCSARRRDLVPTGPRQTLRT